MFPIPIKLYRYFLFFMGSFSTAYVLIFAITKKISSPESKGTNLAFINAMCALPGFLILQPIIGQILHTAINCHISLLNSYKIALLPIPIFILLSIFIIVKPKLIKIKSK